MQDITLHDLAGRGQRWAELLDYLLVGLSVDEASTAMGLTLDNAMQLRSDIVTSLKRRVALAERNDKVSVKPVEHLLQDESRALSNWFAARLGSQFHLAEGRRRS